MGRLASAAYARRLALRSVDIQWKFYGDRPRGTPPSGGLNERGVAKYSDFWHFEGYISPMVQHSR